MRASRWCTGLPSLRPAGVWSRSRGSLAAFPPPALPGFVSPTWQVGCCGTFRLSDFPVPFALLAFSAWSRILAAPWLAATPGKSRWDLTGCPVDIVCNANGPWTPGLLLPLAMTRPPVLPSSMHKPWAGSDSYKISGLNTVHGWTASPVLSSSLPFCVRFNVALRGGTPYSHAATLDTGPVASGYPGGSRTRWSTNHFQSARASLCSGRCGGSAIPRHGPPSFIPQAGRRGNHLWKFGNARRRCQSAWDRLAGLVSREDVHVVFEYWEFRESGSATDVTEAVTQCRPEDLVDGNESSKRRGVRQPRNVRLPLSSRVQIRWPAPVRRGKRAER